MRVQGPWTNGSSNLYWLKVLKLVPRPLDECPRPKKWQKLRLNLHGTCFGGKINWFRPKNS
jgi:hypothetical protein